MTKPKVGRAAAWTIKHGSFVFIDYVRKNKRHAINAYLYSCDPGWTWKRLYACGARAVRVSVTIRVEGRGK